MASVGVNQQLLSKLLVNLKMLQNESYALEDRSLTESDQL